jgi:hypothetical protein
VDEGLAERREQEQRSKPKARYTVVPQRFKNWTLPRLLPARMLDAQLAKVLGLTKS